MFASLLRTRKDRRSEHTPLLAALQRYRSRNADDEHSASEDDDDYDDIARFDGEDEDDGNNGPSRRDGPLLPVFSEFLGMHHLSIVCLLCSLHL